MRNEIISLFSKIKDDWHDYNQPFRYKKPPPYIVILSAISTIAIIIFACFAPSAALMAIIYVRNNISMFFPFIGPAILIIRIASTDKSKNSRRYGIVALLCIIAVIHMYLKYEWFFDEHELSFYVLIFSIICFIL